MYKIKAKYNNNYNTQYELVTIPIEMLDSMHTIFLQGLVESPHMNDKISIHTIEGLVDLTGIEDYSEFTYQDFLINDNDIMYSESTDDSIFELYIQGNKLYVTDTFYDVYDKNIEVEELKTNLQYKNFFEESCLRDLIVEIENKIVK